MRLVSGEVNRAPRTAVVPSAHARYDAKDSGRALAYTFTTAIEDCGSGMGRSFSFNPSRWKAIASEIC